MRHVIKRSYRAGAQPARRRRIRPQYLILLVLMALFAFKFVEKTQEVRSLAAQEAALRAANNLTAQQNAQLRRTIAYDGTTGFIENSARSYYGFTKPGEIPISIQPRYPSLVRAPIRTQNVRPTVPQPAWKQWLRAFFG